MATREKMHQKSKVGAIDMKMVNQLITWRDMRKCQLEGTKYFCRLNPDENKQICKDCPKTIRKACFKYEWERDYIHKKEAAEGENKRRQRKQDNPKHWNLEISVRDEEDDEYADYGTHDEEPVNEMDTKYPCSKMWFACPDKDKCNFGEICPYKSTD